MSNSAGQQPARQGTDGLHRQAIRYILSGGVLALLYSAIYWVAVKPFAVAPLLANSLAFVVTVVTGYAMHSRWSFRGYGQRSRAARLKFVLVNILGYALNSFWVWIIVEHLHDDVAWPLVPILVVTPWLSFYANRRWTFG